MEAPQSDKHCKNGDTCTMYGCICNCHGCSEADKDEFGV